MNAPYDREPDERLADWVDGTMAERDRERFVAELRVSPQLRKELAEYERSVTLVRRALQEPSADAEQTAARVAERVLASLQTAPVRHASPWSAPRLLWGLAAAAALLAIFVWLDRWSVRVPREDVVADGPQAAPFVPPAVEKAVGELAAGAVAEGAEEPNSEPAEPEKGGAPAEEASKVLLRLAQPDLEAGAPVTEKIDENTKPSATAPRPATSQAVPDAPDAGKQGGLPEQGEAEAEKKESAFDSSAWNSTLGLGGGGSKDAKKATGSKEGELSMREQQRAETAKAQALSEEKVEPSSRAEQSVEGAPTGLRTLDVPKGAPSPGAQAGRQPAAGPADTVPVAPGGSMLPQIVVRLPAPVLAKRGAGRSTDTRERADTTPHVLVEVDGDAQHVALGELLGRQLAAMTAGKADANQANARDEDQADAPAARRRQAARDKAAEGAASASGSANTTRWTRAQLNDAVSTGSDDFYLGASRAAEPRAVEQVWVIEGSPAAVQALLRDLATQVADRRGEISHGEIAAKTVVPAAPETQPARKAPAGPATGPGDASASPPSGPTTPGASGPPQPGGGRGAAGPTTGGPMNPGPAGPGGPAVAPRVRIVLRLQVIPPREQR